MFPEDQTELTQAIQVLDLTTPRPVLVLSGGVIDEHRTTITQRAIEVVVKATGQRQALVQSGGTDDHGVMATIGQVRAQSNYDFPLLGVTAASLVTWPDDSRARRFFWQKKKLWGLEPHHTHFILVPGDQFGDETPWFVQAATLLSAEYPSATILVNGGTIARREVIRSLEIGRPVIVLAGTGRLADELAREPSQSDVITIIPADDETAVFEAIWNILTK